MPLAASKPICATSALELLYGNVMTKMGLIQHSTFNKAWRCGSELRTNDSSEMRAVANSLRQSEVALYSASKELARSRLSFLSRYLSEDLFGPNIRLTSR
ncbi:hypothetical protein ACH5RR_014611 [Cinchona calisaya]|uniref:Uncharacterized protein n=1 Tax=Cinchona calisaya TaxID=153742 RepID=A0ABD3A3G3_9GENT